MDLNIRSPALGTTAMVRLLTPDGWAKARSSRRWPVLYLLDDAIEPRVLRESRAFVRRLQALDIPAQTDLYGSGSHDWPYWERELERALPTLLGGLTEADATPAP